MLPKFEFDFLKSKFNFAGEIIYFEISVNVSTSHLKTLAIAVSSPHGEKEKEKRKKIKVGKAVSPEISRNSSFLRRGKQRCVSRKEKASTKMKNYLGGGDEEEEEEEDDEEDYESAKRKRRGGGKRKRRSLKSRIPAGREKLISTSAWTQNTDGGSE